MNAKQRRRQERFEKNLRMEFIKLIVATAKELESGKLTIADFVEVAEDLKEDL